MFVRGGHLARMKRRQVIEDVTPDEFRSLVEHYGELCTITVDKDGKIIPHPNQKMSRDVANVLLASSPKYLLPELTMIYFATRRGRFDDVASSSSSLCIQRSSLTLQRHLGDLVQRTAHDRVETPRHLPLVADVQQLARVLLSDREISLRCALRISVSCRRAIT